YPRQPREVSRRGERGTSELAGSDAGLFSLAAKPPLEKTGVRPRNRMLQPLGTQDSRALSRRSRSLACESVREDVRRTGPCSGQRRVQLSSERTASAKRCGASIIG